MAQPRYLEIADQVAQQIRAGQWTDANFPTVRLLAQQYSVSIVTASRAMQALRDRGLIQIVGRSGAYLIPEVVPKVRTWALWLRLTPGPFQQATQSMIESAFEEAADAQSGRLVTDILAGVGAMTDAEITAAVEALQSAQVLGVLLLPSRNSDAATATEAEFISRCQVVGIPVILIERNLRGIDRMLACDLISSDDFHGGASCTQHLIEQGCQRIGFISSSPTTSHRMRMGGYLATLIQSGNGLSDEDLRPREPVVIWQNAAEAPREAYQRLVTQAVAQKLDGLICYQDYTAVGVIMELMKRQIRVPTDLAVVGFDNLPISQTYAIGVTTYAFPYPAIARRALQLIDQRREDPNSQPMHVILRGELVVRESSQRISS